ncbi:MAG TPA: GAF domain-containing protein, partial [Polyangiaceae bacterium]|nr:GAF domain-containing protein [Polyangiaceae bacterium]
AGPTPASDEGAATTFKPLSAPKPPAAPPPRYASSSDLLARFFEEMPALQALEGEHDAVGFLLALLAQTLPSRVALCHVYDAARREFVVAGARTPSPAAAGRLMGARTPEHDPSIEPLLTRKGAVVVREAGGDARYRGGRWALAGEPARSVAAAAAFADGRPVGLIELANPSDGAPFEEGEGKALEYVAEQFAEFLSRGGPGAGR